MIWIIRNRIYAYDVLSSYWLLRDYYPIVSFTMAATRFRWKHNHISNIRIELETLIKNDGEKYLTLSDRRK